MRENRIIKRLADNTKEQQELHGPGSLSLSDSCEITTESSQKPLHLFSITPVHQQMTDNWNGDICKVSREAPVKDASWFVGAITATI